MNTSLIVVACLLGTALMLIVLYYLIQSATRSADQVRFMKVQIKLLVKIAKANGVGDNDIEEIMKPKKK